MQINQDKGLKPHFGPSFGPKRPILGPANFSQHSDNHYLLDIIILNQNMQNRQKLMHNSRESGRKPHFGPYLALIEPFLAQINFFSKIGFVTFLES